MDILMIILTAIPFICGLLAICDAKGGGIAAKLKRLDARRPRKPMAATDYLTDPPKELDYGYIDFLERELKVAAYDPDRIAFEIATQAEEISATLHIGMDEEDWREALKKYHDMSADEILRGVPYGTHGMIVQQAQARGAGDDWRFDYRIYVIGEVARREVRDRQLDRRMVKKFGETAREAREFFGGGTKTRFIQDPPPVHEFSPGEAKPVDDSWADENIRDGVYGPATRGMVRRMVDSDGNWSEIRSFGS